MTGVIVVTSLLLAGAFSLAWLLGRDLRERIEQPKHGLAERLDRYDRTCLRNRDGGR